jgi:KDO2-lipid IV(A) lauroyltransferase
MPIVFFDCYRIKRGRYEMDLTMISETPKLTEEFEITNTQCAMLEETINKRPYNWLWSHRRWKYKDEYPKYLEQQAKTVNES